MTVKYIAYIESPTDIIGYLMNGNVWTGLDHEPVLKWIEDGNIPDPAFTQEELDESNIEFGYRDLVNQINSIIVEYNGNFFSGSIEAQSFIVSMLTKIEGENPNATRNIYTTNGRLKVALTKTGLNELISVIDTAQELITGA